jgi:hypothetical protein
MKPNLAFFTCLGAGLPEDHPELFEVIKQARSMLGQELSLTGLGQRVAGSGQRASKKFTEIVGSVLNTQRPGPAESHWLGLEKDDIPIPGPTFSHCHEHKSM